MVGKLVLVVALLAPLLSGCESKQEKADKAAKASADSMAALRKQGKTDLSNPEMGAKVLVTLTDTAIELSHKEFPQGQVTFAIVNKAAGPHVARVKGLSGDWKTMPIRPGETVLMAMVVEPDTYAVSMADSAGKEKVIAHIVATGLSRTPDQRNITKPTTTTTSR